MKPTEVSPNRLTDRTERAQAKLARIARWDTINGGARAMVLAKRMDRAQFDAGAIVSEIYGQSNGTVCGIGAYACPECGSVVFGIDAAYGCCSESLAR